jgi:hypothetical protein
MKKLLLLLTVALVAFIAINRQRIYLRDPLGAVYRSEVKQDGAWVFINYNNDVLVQSGGITTIAEYLVQGWNGVPASPVEMKCVLGLACLAQADHAAAVPIEGASKAEMTNQEVSFADGDKAEIRIKLR